MLETIKTGVWCSYLFKCKVDQRIVVVTHCICNMYTTLSWMQLVVNSQNKQVEHIIIQQLKRIARSQKGTFYKRAAWQRKSFERKLQTSRPTICPKLISHMLNAGFPYFWRYAYRLHCRVAVENFWTINNYRIHWEGACSLASVWNMLCVSIWSLPLASIRIVRSTSNFACWYLVPSSVPSHQTCDLESEKLLLADSSSKSHDD